MDSILGIAGLLLLGVLACILFARAQALFTRHEEGDERERTPPPREVPPLEWFLVMMMPAADEPPEERLEMLARRVTALEVAVGRLKGENQAMAQGLAELREARGRDSSRAA